MVKKLQNGGDSVCVKLGSTKVHVEINGVKDGAQPTGALCSQEVMEITLPPPSRPEAG